MAAGAQVPGLDLTFDYFNMDDPVVGGYTPERVALRRAIGLAMNVPREIGVVRRSQAIPAQSPVVPHTMSPWQPPATMCSRSSPRA